MPSQRLSTGYLRPVEPELVDIHPGGFLSGVIALLEVGRCPSH